MLQLSKSIFHGSSVTVEAVTAVSLVVEIAVWLVSFGCMIAEKPVSLDFPLLAVCGITSGSDDRGDMHVSRPNMVTVFLSFVVLMLTASQWIGPRPFYCKQRRGQPSSRIDRVTAPNIY